MANVLFKFGTQAEFDALTSKNENALYWLTDTQRLYRGNVLFAVGKDATIASSGLLSAEDKAKLDALVVGSITNIEASDNSIVVEVESSTRKLKVNVSLDADNLITVGEDGLKVVVDDILSKIAFKTPYDVESNKIITEKDIAGLVGAMHFRGVFKSLEDVANPVAGDVVIIGKKEYVYGGDPAVWSELGDEGIYLTIASAEETYEKKVDAQAKYDELKGFIDGIDQKGIAWGKKNANTTKFEIIKAVDGFLTDDGQNDLRLYIPKGSTYELQNVGAGGNSNYFYATVRAWAPSADVTSCRKGDPAYYDRDFGEQEVVYTDAESGRVYADFWIPIARTDDNGATWVEYGDLSVGNKIIGWNWMIEWYVGDKLLCTGSTRLSLVNTKEQLYSHKDWYIGGIEDKITANTDKLTAQEQAISKVTTKVNTIEESIHEMGTALTWGTIV